MPKQLIDVHCHPLRQDFVELLAALDSRAIDNVALPQWSVERQLEVMDQHEIATSILSLPDFSRTLVGPGAAAKARAINESFAEIVAQHPQRLGAFAIVPMDDIDAANRETEYALDVLKLDGIGVTTHCNGLYLGEPIYSPWFEELNRRRAVLFVHPTTPPDFDPAKTRMNVAVLDFMFDTTRMVTNMVLSGAKQKYDDIHVIATHGGGTIPYLAHRISIIQTMPWAFRDGTAAPPDRVLEILGSFYYDLTASTVPASVDALLRLVPAERLLMGFDYPMMPDQTIAPAIAALLANPGLSDETKQKLLHKNAKQLFPRFN